MRIVYLVSEWLDPTTGPTRKIQGQVGAWRAEGHTVHLLGFDQPERGARILRGADALSRQAQHLSPDVVYVRQHLFVPSLARLMRRFPCVLEINSDDLAELSTRRRSYGVYHRATRRLVLGGADGIISPTNELAVRPSIARYERPVAVIANGIDLAASPQHPAPSNVRPRLVFTYSSSGPWPGVDLLLRAAEHLQEFDFDIVGPPPSVEIPANVKVHGVLSGEACEEVIARADVGVGSLGMHRIGLSEGSTLKVRGYLAAGLPTILSYKDTDFLQGAPFLLELPAGEDVIDTSLPKIRAFVAAQLGRRVPRESIAHLDSMAKERTRLQLFERAAKHESW